MILTIPGKPIGKRRPRFARRGKFVVTYNDQETEEGRFLLDARRQWKAPIMEGPVYLSLTFFMPIPKSTSKKVLSAMRKNGVRHTKKPDLDNMVKFVKDCLNGLVWKDDSQVDELTAKKIYSENPRTVIGIN